MAQSLSAEEITLSNDLVQITCTTKGSQLLPGSLQNQKTGQIVKLGTDLFSLVLTNGDTLYSGEFKLAGDPRIQPLAVNPNASRFSERLPGKELVADLISADGNLQVTWHAILRDGSDYLREQVTLKAGKMPLPLKGIGMLDVPNVTAHATGTVDGSPVADATAFYGVEHPLSINRAEMGYVRCFLPRGATVEPGESFDCSLVIGFVRPGQLRRDFLAYLERERAHPYRPFLHYNSWYDIGYFNKYDEAGALNVINAIWPGTGGQARREAGFLLVRRRLGQRRDIVAVRQDKFPERFCAGGKGGGQIRRGSGHLAFAVGRLRQSARRNGSSTARSRDLKSATEIFRWPVRNTMRASASCCVDVVKKYGINHVQVRRHRRGRQCMNPARDCAISTRC